MSGQNARYQLFFRETQASFGERPVHIVAGLAEAPRGSIDPGVIHQFAPNTDEAGKLESISILEQKVPFSSVDEYGELNDPVEFSSPDAMLRRPIWPLSQIFDLGALQFRTVDVPPSEEGNDVFATFGMVAARGLALDHSKISVFEGQRYDIEPKQFRGYLGHDVMPDRDVPDMVDEMRGEAMIMLWRKPLWGFGREAYMIPTFACQEEVSAWKEIATRIGAGQEFSQLPDHLQKWLGVQRDEEYAEFTRYLHEHYPDHIEAAYSPRTAGQDAIQKGRVEEAVRECLAARGGMAP